MVWLFDTFCRDIIGETHVKVKKQVYSSEDLISILHVIYRTELTDSHVILTNTSFHEYGRFGNNFNSSSTLVGDRDRHRANGPSGAESSFRDESMSPPRPRRDSPDYNAPFA